MDKNDSNTFPLGKTNFILIAAGMATVVIGFFLMSGGGSDDVTQFNPEVFSFRRISLAPIVTLIGYGTVMYGIIKK